MKIHHQILQSFSFFTRLPLPRWCPPAESLASLVWMFPIMGALLGFVSAELYALLCKIGLAHGLAAVLMLVFQLYLTGALHEDGLADTVDGFAGGRTKESRLTIMRDSHIGSFGTLALIISVLLRTYAIVLLSNPKAVLLACITAGAMSRAMISLAMFSVPPARTDGMAAWAGKPSDIQVAISIGAACILTLVCAHTAGMIIIAASFLTCSLVCAISRHKIEGITGDVYGAVQQVIEITILIIATVIARH